MSGILYGVGVGPGDPELMTLKAIRAIKENPVIALPGEQGKDTVAYQIAVQTVPELEQKELLSIPMPMTQDKAILEKSHQEGASLIEGYLDQDINIVFLTLGDPTVYSTFSYVKKIVENHGYATSLINGVTSFCAAAARMNTSLAEWNEPLHVIPTVHRPDLAFDQPGNYVLMKSGKKITQVKTLLRESHHDVAMVENCGMPGEHVYRGVEEIPDSAGYYSLIIAKEQRSRQ